MTEPCRALVNDEAGTTAIEYSLLAALAAIACIGALMNFGESMGMLYTIIDAIAGAL